VLPTRKQRLADKISERSCQKRSLRGSLKRAVGPLLPSGEFVSVGKLRRGQSRPLASDWSSKKKSTNRGGNWEPIYTSLSVLDSDTKRKICKNPSRIFKENLPGGSEKLFPTRNSVLSFNRRAHALNFIQQACGLMSEVEPHLLVEPVNEILGLLPEVFRGSPTANSAYRRMNCVLHYLKRQCSKDVRSRINDSGEKL
jgi:hypothetical protein